MPNIGKITPNNNEVSTNIINGIPISNNLKGVEQGSIEERDEEKNSLKEGNHVVKNENDFKKEEELRDIKKILNIIIIIIIKQIFIMNNNIIICNKTFFAFYIIFDLIIDYFLTAF